MTEREAFEAALELAPEARAGFLEAASGGDPAMRARLAALLGQHDQAGSFLESPAADLGRTTDPPESPERPGGVIGPYKLLEQIGEGGFGVVFLAEQQEPVRRKVALKVLKAGMDTRQVVARFEAERQALAIMDHPNIARVFDGGATPSGRPYFVMELVKGTPITEFCDQHHLTPRQRLELFVPVCQAIQHAHQKGIIHRDLKPSNVLVSRHDTTAVVKVIDFGVAKALGQSLTDKTLFTGVAQMVGTPLYMSPEQAGMSDLDVDTRSDIYSLGVLLYELLTGTTPFTKERFRQAAYDEIRRIIREEEPPKPSTRLSDATASLPSVAAVRQTEPAKLTKLVRGELDWIVMKALEKDRGRRYESANVFAADVLRYLAGEAVQAVPPSTIYRLKKFVRRNRGPVVSATLVLFVVVGGIVGTGVGLWRAVKARQAEVARAEGERQAKERAEENFALANKAVWTYLEAVTNDPELKRVDLTPLRKKLVESAIPFLQRIAGQKGDDPEVEARRGRAYLRLAYLRNVLGENEATLQDYEAARAIFDRLATDFPAVRDYRFQLGRSHQYMGQQLYLLQKPKEAESYYRRAADIHQGLVDEDPTEPEYRHELSISLNTLGLLPRSATERVEAEAALRRAADIQQGLVDEFPKEPGYRRSLAQSHNNLGNLLWFLGEDKKAVAAYLRARDIQQELVDRFPDVPEYRLDLAKHHANLGGMYEVADRTKAKAAYREARSHLEKLADRFPMVPEYREGAARVNNDLGHMLRRLGEREDAEAAYRRAADVLKKLTADFPGKPEYREQLAQSHNNLAELLLDWGKPGLVEPILLRAITVRQELVDQFSQEPRYRGSLALSHSNLGLLLRDLRKYEQAENAFRRAERILQELVERFPGEPHYQQALAESYNYVGVVLSDQNEHKKAEEAHRRALTIREELARQFPKVAAYAVDVGGSYCNVGRVLRGAGDPKGALVWYDKAVERLTPLLAGKQPSAAARQYLRNSHWERAQALDAIGRHADAVRDWERALALDDGSARAELRPGLAFSRLWGARKDNDAARCLAAAAEYEALAGTTAGWLYNAACARSICAAVIPLDPKTPAPDAARLAKKEADLAMAWLHKAVAAGFSNASHMKQDKDLDALSERDDFKKLLAELENKK